MLRQLSSGVAMGLVLAVVRHAGAQEMEAPMPEIVPPPAAIRVSPGYTLPYQRGCSLKRICQWLTYRPLPQPVPACCQGPRCQTSALPPLYLYFIGEFGPRSPDLAHMTGGFAAGSVYQGPLVFETAVPPPGVVRSNPPPVTKRELLVTRPVAKPVMVRPVIKQVTAAPTPRPQIVAAKPVAKQATAAPATTVSTRVIGREIIVPFSETSGRPRWRKPNPATVTMPTWGPPATIPGAVAPKAAVQPAATPAGSTMPVSAPAAPAPSVPVKTAAVPVSTPTSSGSGAPSGIIAGQLPPMPREMPVAESPYGDILFHSASPEMPLHRVSNSSPATGN